MRESTRAAALLVCGLFGAGCSGTPKLVPHPSRLELTDMIDRAELIVIGVVDGGSEAGPVVTSDGMPMRLCRVSVQVENVLKGNAPLGELRFFFYNAEGAWDGPSFNVIEPRERAIFFLVRDGSVLRATNDVYLSHATVRAGRHPGLPRSATPLKQTIAEALLIPGPGTETERYRGFLHSAKALSLGLVGRGETVALLESLLKNRNAQFRGGACIALAEFPIGERQCLPALIGDSEALPQDRVRAEELMRQN